jgi:cathepsin B
METKTFGTTLRHELNPSLTYQSRVVRLSLDDEALKKKPPVSFDGRVVWKKYLSPIMTQGVTSACYAFATLSTLQDLFALYTKNRIKPRFSVMEALSCNIVDLNETDSNLIIQNPKYLMDLANRSQYTGYKSGNLFDMARFLFRRGAVEQTCVSDGWIQTFLERNNKLPTCRELSGPGNFPFRCSPYSPNTAKRFWTITNFYAVTASDNSKELIQEIKLNICLHGPIVAGFVLFPDFVNEYNGLDVYVPKPNQESLGGHAVKIVGWGPDYWIAANSWGISWGDQGYFKIAINHPDLKLEENHISLVPGIPKISLYFNDVHQHSTALVRSIDEMIRNLDPVDPYNLYTNGAIQNIRLGILKGDVNKLIFTNNSVDIDENIFVIQDEKNTQKIIQKITQRRVLITFFIFLITLTIFVCIYKFG